MLTSLHLLDNALKMTDAAAIYDSLSSPVGAESQFSFDDSAYTPEHGDSSASASPFQQYAFASFAQDLPGVEVAGVYPSPAQENHSFPDMEMDQFQLVSSSSPLLQHAHQHAASTAAAAAAAAAGGVGAAGPKYGSFASAASSNTVASSNTFVASSPGGDDDAEEVSIKLEESPKPAPATVATAATAAGAGSKPPAKRKRENRYKNAPPSVLNRRRAQNRASQRAYRERKDQRIRDLESELESMRNELGRTRGFIAMMQEELMSHRPLEGALQNPQLQQELQQQLHHQLHHHHHQQQQNQHLPPSPTVPQAPATATPQLVNLSLDPSAMAMLGGNPIHMEQAMFMTAAPPQAAMAPPFSM